MLGQTFSNSAVARNPNHLFSTRNRAFFFKHNCPPTPTVFFNNLLCFLSHFWFCLLFSLLLPDFFSFPVSHGLLIFSSLFCSQGCFTQLSFSTLHIFLSHMPCKGSSCFHQMSPESTSTALNWVIMEHSASMLLSSLSFSFFSESQILCKGVESLPSAWPKVSWEGCSCMLQSSCLPQLTWVMELSLDQHRAWKDSQSSLLHYFKLHKYPFIQKKGEVLLSTRCSQMVNLVGLSGLNVPFQLIL